jgi:UDP-glucose 4-epimerase
MNENSPLGPLSPYGVSKLEAEKKLLEVGVDTKFRALIFRYFNVVGHLEDSLQEKNAKNLVPILRGKRVKFPQAKRQEIWRSVSVKFGHDFF